MTDRFTEHKLICSDWSNINAAVVKDRENNIRNYIRYVRSCLELNILSILKVWTVFCSKSRDYEGISVTQIQNSCPVACALSLQEQLKSFCITLKNTKP